MMAFTAFALLAHAEIFRVESELSRTALALTDAVRAHRALPPLDPEILAKFKALEAEVREDHQRVRRGPATVMDSS